MITHEDLIRYLTDDGYVFTYDESIEQEIIKYENSFRNEGRNEVITELLETSKYGELSQKIALDILNRGIERGKMLAGKEIRNKTIEEMVQIITKLYEDLNCILECEHVDDGVTCTQCILERVIMQMKGENI